jgi:hypothetical protein
MSADMIMYLALTGPPPQTLAPWRRPGPRAARKRGCGSALDAGLGPGKREGRALLEVVDALANHTHASVMGWAPP